ncbi:hypothetical protein FKP32DRAFT_294598 [Trametes sanguinea]|nr:hypothetical protein FKP32DRAFT_294598 [Trametes sanguinea]
MVLRVDLLAMAGGGRIVRCDRSGRVESPRKRKRRRLVSPARPTERGRCGGGKYGRHWLERAAEREHGRQEAFPGGREMTCRDGRCAVAGLGGRGRGEDLPERAEVATGSACATELGIARNALEDEDESGGGRGSPNATDDSLVSSSYLASFVPPPLSPRPPPPPATYKSLRALDSSPAQLLSHPPPLSRALLSSCSPH